MESKIFNKDNMCEGELANINIYYHGKCPDGECSLNIIRYYLNSKMSREHVDTLKCFPLTHPYSIDDTFFENAKDKHIIMVDFSLKYKDLQRLIDVCKTFIILDHHKGAQEELELIDSSLKIFRMDKSGAGLAWEYFFGSTPQPRVVTFVEDQDIWTFKDPDTKAFNTIFHGLVQTYDLWLSYVNDEDVVKRTIEKGRAMLEYETTLVNNTCNLKGESKIHEVNGEYIIVASLGSCMLTSQIGNTLINRDKFADYSCVFSISKGKTKFSLRSEDSRMDVSQVARSFPKGGGHRNASSFELDGLYDCMCYPLIDDEGLLEAMKTAVITNNMTTIKLPKLTDNISGSEKISRLLHRKFSTRFITLEDESHDWCF